MMVGKQTIVAGTVSALLMLSLAATGLATHRGDAADAWELEESLGSGSGGNAGADVALEGDTAFVGVPFAAEDGAVDIYVRDESGTWELSETLTAPDGGGQFGESVDVDAAGDTLLVSDRDADTAYVYEEAPGWTKTAELTPSDTSTLQSYGAAVALSDDGEVAIVGDRFASTGERMRNGQAFLFERTDSGWTQVAEHAGAEGAGLGAAVALEAGTALVGDPGAREVRVLSSSAGWSEIHTIAGGHDFGRALALDSGTALISSSEGVTEHELAAGWAQTDTLPYEGYGDFGASLALDRDTAVVGVRGTLTTPGGPAAGEAVVLERTADGWERVDHLRNHEGLPGTGTLAQFGTATALDASRALVGAPDETNDGGLQAGAAYVFSACTEDGDLSRLVHDEIEPFVAGVFGAEDRDRIHEENCHRVEAVEP